MKVKRNKVQELNLRLIEEASYNSFDGKRVVADLREHGGLWGSVMMNHKHCPLIALRDLPGGVWNVSTLWILTTTDRMEALKALAETWEVDTIGELRDAEMQIELGSYMGRQDNRCVLWVWWD